MKLRYRRKQFWWHWHQGAYDRVFMDALFRWGIARIKHQQKD